jgi:hypothetical protein
MSDRLESMLSDLADTLVWPVDSTSVEQSVLDNLGGRQARRPERRRKLTYALAAVFLLSIIVYIVPPARQAVANLFGAAGIHITFGDPTFERAVGDLELGTEFTLGEIDDAAGFDVVAPAGSDPGPPDGVFVGENSEVNMAWEGTPELPAAGDTGIGLLLTQGLERSGEYRGVKAVSPETDVESVLVDGAQGLWIEGAHHALVLVDETGVERHETRRLAANVLLWALDGISYRLETTGDLASAIAIAESLSPVSH